MLADFFTVPIEGKVFRNIRDQIMGFSELPIEERVRNRTEIENQAKNITIGNQKTNQHAKGESQK